MAQKKKARPRGVTRLESGAPVRETVTFASGTPKKVPEGPRRPRLSHHKKRAAWFRARVAWPLREAMTERLAAERRRARESGSSAKLANWELAGPTNIGGRCTCLVCDPANPDRIWIGAAGGGVWASTDAGKTWKVSWPDHAPLEVGSLAVDPSKPNILYCGTGEANLSADSYAGDGIYRSTNGGKTWSAWARSTRTGVPRRVGVIAVDPFDSKHVMAGGIGYGRLSADNDLGGMYTTRDGGKTWNRENFISVNNYWCHSIVFDATRTGRIFATVTGPGAPSGIYRSDDGGRKWSRLTTGLPATERMGRTTLALAPSEPRIIYALATDERSDRADRVLGVFKSEDSGKSWRNVAGSHFDNEGQISYGNTIAVHPQDPAHVICGGVDLHLTRDGGKTWKRATRWNAKRGHSDYAHADHHAMVMPGGAPGRVYDANDGGLDVSDDGGERWKNRSAGLSITMFYDIDVAQTDERVYGGGAQDNGTLVTREGKADRFSELEGGDGGWMVIDPNEAGHVYASWQFGGMTRFRNGVKRDVSPPFKDSDSDGVWMVYITIDPNDSDIVYTGNQRVYRTTNDGRSWDALTPVLDGSPISAIEVAPADSKVIYVGTENGGLFRSFDRGATWSANLMSPDLPGVMITRIETNPGNAREVFATFGNFGNSHVFRSPDGGSTWIDIDGGKLPDVPHHALLIRPDSPSELWICNDAGVFVTRDKGKKWLNFTSGLPNVMVIDIVYREPTRTLLAATYGRSIWRLKL
jgi:photosystem II stability/assembly factor-like uncharacterized protein